MWSMKLRRAVGRTGGTSAHPTISAALPILTKGGRAEAARPPLFDPAIVDLRIPSQPPRSTEFNTDQDSVGGTPQIFRSHRSVRELECWNRLAVLSASLPSPTSQTPWRRCKRKHSSTCSSPSGGNVATAWSNRAVRQPSESQSRREKKSGSMRRTPTEKNCRIARRGDRCVALVLLYACRPSLRPETPGRGRSVENSRGSSTPRQAISATLLFESAAETSVLIPSARTSSSSERRQ